MFRGYFSEFVSNSKDTVITLLTDRIERKQLTELSKCAAVAEHCLRIINQVVSIQAID